MKKKVIARVAQVTQVSAKVRDRLAIVGAVLLLTSSFLTASGDIDIDAPFGLAAVASSLMGKTTMVITKNVNSPSGTIVPGRSQGLAVFDIKANNLSQKALLERTVVNVAVSGDASLTLNNFVLDYRFCVPAGNIYAYGYQYSYQGMFCRSASAWPVSAVRVGNMYTVTFAPQFVIYPGQTVSNLMLSGYAYYPLPSTSKTIAKVRASLQRGSTAVQTSTCTNWRYGYAYRYSYTTCRAVGISATVSSALGNHLSVLRTYGYGYTTTTNTTTNTTNSSPGSSGTSDSTVTPEASGTSTSQTTGSTNPVSPRTRTR
jgi:hypothetical protein